MVESGTNSLFGSLPRDENGGLVPGAIGKIVDAYTPISPIHLSPMCGRNVEWKNDTNSGKYITLQASKGLSGINYILQ